jgi:hypothetical protein
LPFIASKATTAMKRNLTLLLGCATYLIMIGMAAALYKERTVFVDIAYHLFFLMKDQTWCIQNFRFGAACTQAFPLAAAKAGASLQTVALIYSLAFPIFYFATFLVIHKVLKNEKLALVFLLCNILMTTHVFYWIQSELPQGMALMFLYLALLDKVAQKETIPTYFVPLSCLLLFAVTFTHPLLLFPFMFVIGYWWLTRPGQRKLWLSAALSYLVFCVIKQLFFKTQYDSAALNGVSNFRELFPNYFTIQSNKNFVRYVLHDYYFLVILLALNCLYYLRKRSYKPMLLMLAAFGGYLLLVNITYHGGADQFYLENQYLVLTVFVALPFVCDILPAMKPRIPLIFVSVIALVGLVRIWHTHDFYTARLNWNRRLLAQTAAVPQQKLVIAPDKAPKDTLLMTWAASYEFWLLSTIEGGATRSVIIEDNTGEFDGSMGNNKAFISKWGVFDYNQFPQRYFHFTDSSSVYIKY